MLAILAWGLAGCAPAAGGKAPVPPAAVAVAAVRHPLQAADLPLELGGLARGKATSYDSPEQGVSVAYAGPGLEGAVFLYDGGAKDLPENLDAPAVLKEFAGVVNEVNVWVRAGWARGVQVRESFVLESHGRPEFLAAVLDIDTKSGNRDSYLFLTSHQGQFIKIRLTGALGQDSRDRAVGFALDLGRTLWPGAAS